MNAFSYIFLPERIFLTVQQNQHLYQNGGTASLTATVPPPTCIPPPPLPPLSVLFHPSISIPLFTALFIALIVFNTPFLVYFFFLVFHSSSYFYLFMFTVLLPFFFKFHCSGTSIHLSISFLFFFCI